MKKACVYLFLGFLAIGTVDAFADVSGYMQVAARNTKRRSNNNSPYLESNSKVITVEDLKNARDDENVTLKGYIIKKIKKEKYLFKDSTGEITIEIDSKINNQLKNVDENTLVEIYGEYDKEYFGRSEIDVKKITIVRQ